MRNKISAVLWGMVIWGLVLHERAGALAISESMARITSVGTTVSGSVVFKKDSILVKAEAKNDHYYYDPSYNPNGWSSLASVMAKYPWTNSGNNWGNMWAEDTSPKYSKGEAKANSSLGKLYSGSFANSQYDSEYGFNQRWNYSRAETDFLGSVTASGSGSLLVNVDYTVSQTLSASDARDFAWGRALVSIEFDNHMDEIFTTYKLFREVRDGENFSRNSSGSLSLDLNFLSGDSGNLIIRTYTEAYAVPEPSGFVLFFIGLFLFFFMKIAMKARRHKFYQ